MQYLESGIYIACSRLQDSGEETHREKLHENCGVEGGGGVGDDFGEMGNWSL